MLILLLSLMISLLQIVMFSLLDIEAIVIHNVSAIQSFLGVAASQDAYFMQDSFLQLFRKRIRFDSVRF